MDDAYDAVALRCHACAARDRKSREFSKDEASDVAGLFIAVTDPADTGPAEED